MENGSVATLNLSVSGSFRTTAQVCAKYQVSRTTWWRWSKLDGFPKPIRFGRSVRWDDSVVEAFLTQQEV